MYLVSTAVAGVVDTEGDTEEVVEEEVMVINHTELGAGTFR